MRSFSSFCDVQDEGLTFSIHGFGSNGGRISSE
jgi:hypothetical protein